MNDISPETLLMHKYFHPDRSQRSRGREVGVFCFLLIYEVCI